MGSLREQYQAQQTEKTESRFKQLLTPLNLGIAAAVAVTVLILVIVVPGLIPKSPEEMYAADRTVIREAVLVYATGFAVKQGNVMTADVSAVSYDNYPTFAAVNFGSSLALKEEDAGNDEIVGLLLESHPGGGKRQGGTPHWEDVDGDGLRRAGDEKLFYHNASPQPAVDHWNTTPMTLNDVDYVVDSRNWFINMDILVERGYLKKLPESASSDNSMVGTGSYSYYLNKDLDIQSILHSRPTVDTDGFQQVYP